MRWIEGLLGVTVLLIAVPDVVWRDSRKDIDKCVFIPVREPMTSQRDHTTKVQLGKSVSLSVLLRGVSCEVTYKSRDTAKAAASLKAALAWVTACGSCFPGDFCRTCRQVQESPPCSGLIWVPSVPPISRCLRKEGLCESAQFEGLPETYVLFTSWVLKNILPDFLSLNEIPSELSSFKELPSRMEYVSSRNGCLAPFQTDLCA